MFPCSTALRGTSLLHFWGFEITLRHTTVGRTPLEEGSARGRDIYRTTHNIHNRQTRMSPAGFVPPIPASKWPQTHILDRAALGSAMITIRVAIYQQSDADLYILTISIDKSHNNAVYCFEQRALWRWLQVAAVTCRSTSVITLH